jgi:hypothetical protein
MMKSLLFAGAPALIALVSLISAVTGLQAAVDLVSGHSTDGTVLFDYEKLQLTDEAIERIAKTEAAAPYAHLFGFDNGTDAGSTSLNRSGTCKTFPGDESWPSGNTWEVFNKLLGGSLIPTIPLAAPCYKNWGNYDAAKCDTIIQKFRDPYLQYVLSIPPFFPFLFVPLFLVLTS